MTVGPRRYAWGVILGEVRARDVEEEVSVAPFRVEPASVRVLKCCDCFETMQVVTIDGVDVDECPSCAMRWFDEGELDRIVHLRRATCIGSLGPHAATPASSYPCSVCGESTAPFQFNAAPQVQLHACSRHGQWLDAWGVRNLVHWGRKEAALVEHASTGVYHRRSERALWAGFAFLDHVSGLKLVVAAVFWVLGSRVPAGHGLLGLVYIVHRGLVAFERFRDRCATRM